MNKQAEQLRKLAKQAADVEGNYTQEGPPPYWITKRDARTLRKIAKWIDEIDTWAYEAKGVIL